MGSQVGKVKLVMGFTPKKKKIGDGTNKLKIFYCKQYAFRGIVKKIIPISNLKRWVYWFINSTININSYINFIIN